MSLSEPFHIENQGMVLPGHRDTPRAAREETEQLLLAAGTLPFYAAKYTEAAPVELAWMAGGDFVQEDHEGAEPVTVVLVPAPPEESA